MKKITIVTAAVAVASMLLFGTGCATVVDILDILAPPDPCPVCDKESVGVHVNGKTCVKFDDGTYRWVPDAQ